MSRLFRFVTAAFTAGVAYIDCDGCILKKFPVPEHICMPFRLLWWSTNLDVTPVITRRLPLLYFLRLFGVRLVLWTNRGAQHHTVTLRALGSHARLFDGLRFRNGTKIQDFLDGPIMEDDERYLVCSKYPGLLVKSL